MVSGITKDEFDIDLIVVIFEMNLVGSNPKDWWIDTGATHHVYCNKNMLSTFKPIESGEKVFMVNSATSEIKGQVKVGVKMTYGKKLTLKKYCMCLKSTRT